MKAAVVRAPGTPPVCAEFEAPVPRGDEMRVQVTAAALSPLARARASGAHYSAGAAFPRVAGVDGAGRLADGTRIYFFAPRAPWGAMAEQAAVPPAHLVPIPDALGEPEAAALANPGMASWAALSERARLTAGETVLINGATSASGRLAIGIARRLGAGRVIGAARDAAALGRLDLDEAIVLGEGMEAPIARALERGVDVALDFLWGPSAALILGTAAAQGAGRSEARPELRFVQIGAASGAEIALPGAWLRSTAVSLMGSGLGGVSTARLMAAIAGVLEAAAAGALSLPLVETPLEAVESHWDTPSGDARRVFRISPAA